MYLLVNLRKETLLMSSNLINTDLRHYISFCNLFQKYNLPILRFKELPDEYKQIYKHLYRINEEMICKATFIVFLLSLIPSFLVFLLLFNLGLLFFDILYPIILAIIIATIISYNFNTTIYKRIKKDEKLTDALLPLVKINFSLIRSVQDQKTDLCLSFIKLVADYKLPISIFFKIIYNKAHLGFAPERELSIISTPSKDFNAYVSELLITNFGAHGDYDENSAEKNFRVLLKSLDSKIGLIFFVGLFFPLVLCAFILFQNVKVIFMLFVAPLLLFLMYWMFKKLVRINIALIGVLDEYSDVKEKQFSEFLLFLESLMLNLKNNYSPEIAFVKAYSKNKPYLVLLNDVFRRKISALLSLQYTFKDLIDQLKLELDSPRYKVILNVIYTMLEKSAYYSSEKIADIIQIIEKHRRLEQKFKTVVQGKKFVVMVFVLLFPVILGTIGGMLPLIIAVIGSMDSVEKMEGIKSLSELVDLFDVVLIFSILLSCTLITSYFFLKIVRYNRMPVILSLSTTIFIISFLQSLLYAISFF